MKTHVYDIDFHILTPFPVCHILRAGGPSQPREALYWNPNRGLVSHRQFIHTLCSVENFWPRVAEAAAKSLWAEADFYCGCNWWSCRQSRLHWHPPCKKLVRKFWNLQDLVGGFLAQIWMTGYVTVLQYQRSISVAAASSCLCFILYANVKPPENIC